MAVLEEVDREIDETLGLLTSFSHRTSREEIDQTLGTIRGLRSLRDTTTRLAEEAGPGEDDE
jgi:hypothetical protein